jgi:stage II sporulation protein R
MRFIEKIERRLINLELINYYIMKKIFQNSLIILFLFILFFLVCAKSYATNVFSDLSENVFRLHILANSNSDEDQNLKLKVRDSIVEYMKNITKDVSKKDDVIKICKNHIANIQEIAENVIRENGYDYPVNIEIGNFYFPTKNYANISFPAGYYDALRIKIGKAAGNNWWCSLFPPLCFVDISSGVLENEDEKILENNLETEEYELITGENNSTKFKFKIVELFNENFKK